MSTLQLKLLSEVMPSILSFKSDQQQTVSESELQKSFICFQKSFAEYIGTL